MASVFQSELERMPDEPLTPTEIEGARRAAQAIASYRKHVVSPEKPFIACFDTNNPVDRIARSLFEFNTLPVASEEPANPIITNDRVLLYVTVHEGGDSQEPAMLCYSTTENPFDVPVDAGRATIPDQPSAAV